MPVQGRSPDLILDLAPVIPCGANFHSNVSVSIPGTPRQVPLALLDRNSTPGSGSGASRRGERAENRHGAGRHYVPRLVEPPGTGIHGARGEGADENGLTCKKPYMFVPQKPCVCIAIIGLTIG